MISSEFVYTSWKNGGINSGFTTFAKSSDVTGAEADEIVGKLAYVKPVDLSDRPTEEEIDAVFPRNSAYFRLKSGRYCMAQATYVGKDYAVDVNARWANYIIHAYIFEENDSFFPEGYIDSEVFKRGLTDEEREYDGVVTPEPSDLAELDPAMFADEAMTEILEKGEEEDYFLFLQAIIDRAFNDSCLLIDISDRDKINRWMRALPIVLPKCYMKNITYGTYLLYKNPEFKINFLYNTSGFNSSAEINSFPDNAVLFYDSGVIHGEAPLCEYLLEYRKCLAVNCMSAYRLKDDIDTVFASDSSLSLSKALKVKHYLKRDVEYFTDFSEFEKLTVYLLKNKSFARISEISMYMIQNSFFSETEKRSLFFIGDVFLRLDENEKDVVRQEFFGECFRRSESSEEFVEAYRNNPMVTGDHSPLTHAFFRQFIEAGSDESQKEKALRYIVELEKDFYDEFDHVLKAHFFRLSEVYFVQMVNRGKYDSAVKCIQSVKKREDAQRAGMTAGIIEELLDGGSNCFYDLEFAFDIMCIIFDERSLYWGVFKRVYDIWWNSQENRRELIKMYMKKIKRSDPSADSDIGEYASKLGFEDFVPTMEMNAFNALQGKTIHDFTSTFNSLFGIGCPYERSDNLCGKFYGMLSEHLDSVRNSDGGNKKSGKNGLYMWISEMSGFIINIEAAKANEKLLDWISGEIVKNMTLAEFCEMSDVNVNFIFIRSWAALSDSWAGYPDLIRYLDVLSVRSANYRRNFFPYYVDNTDTILGTVSDKKIGTFIECVMEAMLKDNALTAEECDELISPFLLYDNRKYRGKTFESLIDGFGTAVDAGNIEPFYWIVQFYAAKLQYKSESEHIEENLIFPILGKYRKPLMSILDGLSEENKKAYILIFDYLDGLTFNMFNKPKRVKSMKLRRQ